MMIPLDAQNLDAYLRIALHNIAEYDRDHQAADEWLRKQPDAVQRLAKRRPLNRIYRVTTQHQDVELYAVIVSYQVRRSEPQCGIQILGVFEGAGSNGDPIGVPEDALEDVTDAIRRRFSPRY